ncbi:MAG: hypothetical protein ACRYFU_24565 [Janthinobacterium lividum]
MTKRSPLQTLQIGFTLLGFLGAVFCLLAMGNVHSGPVLKRVAYFSFLTGLLGQTVVGFLARRKY